MIFKDTTSFLIILLETINLASRISVVNYAILPNERPVVHSVMGFDLKEINKERKKERKSFM